MKLLDFISKCEILISNCAPFMKIVTNLLLFELFLWTEEEEIRTFNIFTNFHYDI